MQFANILLKIFELISIRGIGLIIFSLRFYLFLERGEGRNRERNINVWLPHVHPYWGPTAPKFVIISPSSPIHSTFRWPSLGNLRGDLGMVPTHSKFFPRPKLPLTLSTSPRYHPGTENITAYGINERTSAYSEEHLINKSSSQFMTTGEELPCSGRALFFLIQFPVQ